MDNAEGIHYMELKDEGRFTCITPLHNILGNPLHGVERK